MVLVSVTPPLLKTVGGKKQTEIYYPDDYYTQIIGKLDNADYEILIPDEWNGMLIIGCRGHTADFSPWVPFPPTTMPNVLFHTYGVGFVDDGFAFAWSNYGEGGFCIKDGMIRTHQLTEFVIDKYDVSGKVFLWSFSMGGMIACLLGEKYPALYSGVIDMNGPKNMTELYMLVSMIGNTDVLEEFETECNGSPWKKPQAYEKRSPISNPELSIPVIVIHGVLDTTVPFAQSVAYEQVVNDASELDLCRLYPIPDEGHGGPISWAFSRFVALPELVAWSNSLDS